MRETAFRNHWGRSRPLRCLQGWLLTARITEALPVTVLVYTAFLSDPDLLRLSEPLSPTLPLVLREGVPFRPAVRQVTNLPPRSIFASATILLNFYLYDSALLWVGLDQSVLQHWPKVPRCHDVLDDCHER